MNPIIIIYPCVIIFLFFFPMNLIQYQLLPFLQHIFKLIFLFFILASLCLMRSNKWQKKKEITQYKLRLGKFINKIFLAISRKVSIYPPREGTCTGTKHLPTPPRISPYQLIIQDEQHSRTTNDEIQKSNIMTN